jgi:UDP-N-acetylmuramoyl-L-alanyl-D-glutamate--2,6-diaminopimelate ligase
LLQVSKKKRVFAVINTDDSWGAQLRWGSRVQRLTYGQADQDFRFKIQKQTVEGTEFVLKSAEGSWTGFVPVPGQHNVYNAVAAVAAATVLGVGVKQSLDAIGQFHGVPGRLEKVSGSREFSVFVDYAHTPDALQTVLKTLRPLTADLRVVFGCGGDRDKGKRPLMLRAALEGATGVVLTSDNPRTEDPQKIIEDCLQGVAIDKKQLHIEVDRKKAIEWALNQAKIGSVVLIAGKGHEDYQQVGQQKLPFSDQHVVREYLQ